MENKGSGKRILIDIETNGLRPSKIWCVVAKVEGSGRHDTFFKPEELKAYAEEHADDTFYAHNGMAFDFYILQRLWSIVFKKVGDTLVMSRLGNPGRVGGHSLRAWGERLGFPKGDHSDWSCFSPEMLAYCKQDTDVTERMLPVLDQELKGYKPECFTLENDVARIIAEQERNGWLLDQRRCLGLLSTIKERKNEIEQSILETFTPIAVFDKEVFPKYTQKGELSKVGLKFLDEDWVNVGGPMSRIMWQSFNLNSRQQIAVRLQRVGWEPTEYTEKGSIIVDESTLEGVDIPEVQMILEFLMLGKRQAQVSSWIEAVQPDGRVHGRVNPIGAITGRMTHSDPNMAQVPASRKPYGKECRACWVVPEGRKLVGMDASGLELRMLAHYMNDEAYTQEILDGDIHTANQNAAGLSTRDEAKTFIYAFLYGAGDAKIGSIVGGSAKDGRQLKDRFLNNTPALKTLRTSVSKAANRGYLRGLDGRHIHVRSSHAALNTLLQGAGAIVMKKALVILDDYAQRWKLDYKIIGNIHDEIQVEVLEKDAERFGRLAVGCMEAAGLALNLNCPIAGEYKIGNNWSETH